MNLLLAVLAAASLHAPSFAGIYRFEDVAPGGPGAPQTYELTIQLRRTPEGYMGTASAAGFQLDKVYALVAKPEGQGLLLTTEAAGKPGPKFGVLKRGQAGFELELGPAAPETPTGVRKLVTETMAAPKVLVRGIPPAPVVGLRPGLSAGELKLGAKRADLVRQGAISDGGTGLLLGIFRLTLVNDVVTAIEFTPAEADVRAQLGKTTLLPTSTFEEAVAAAGTCSKPVVGAGGTFVQCAAGVNVKLAPGCLKWSAKGTCVDFTGAPTMSLQVIQAPEI